MGAWWAPLAGAAAAAAAAARVQERVVEVRGARGLWERMGKGRMGRLGICLVLQRPAASRAKGQAFLIEPGWCLAAGAATGGALRVVPVASGGSVVEGRLGGCK